VTSATIKNGEMLEIAARVICDALIQIRFSHVDEMSHTRPLTFELTPIWDNLRSDPRFKI